MNSAQKDQNYIKTQTFQRRHVSNLCLRKQSINKKFESFFNYYHTKQLWKICEKIDQNHNRIWMKKWWKKEYDIKANLKKSMMNKNNSKRISFKEQFHIIQYQNLTKFKHVRENFNDKSLQNLS